MDDHIDYNEISLFSTPLGEKVQKEDVDALLNYPDLKSDRLIYVKNINQCLNSISQSFWDIDLTIKLIAFADPKIKSFKMTRVDRDEYLRYHFENYFFRLPKLKDQVLNLLNIVYQLKYNQAPNLEKKIRNTKILQDKGLLLFIDYFNEMFSNIKPIRDTIAHRGDIPTSDFALLKAYTLDQNYDSKVYNILLKNLISQTYVFKKNQSTLKQAVIILLLNINDDFNTALESFN